MVFHGKLNWGTSLEMVLEVAKVEEKEEAMEMVMGVAKVEE